MNFSLFSVVARITSQKDRPRSHHGNLGMSFQMCLPMKKSGFPTRSDTNGPVESQNGARGLKFWISVEEKLYYLSSENKSADQLCSYFTAQLICTFVLAYSSTSL